MKTEIEDKKCHFANPINELWHLIDIVEISYGLWIKKHGNIAGAIFIFGLALLSVGLPIYKIVTSP